ncbi:WXG100 family type VII secretion target [Nocardia fluminea]|uniref:WXG100 family type VII secretion target n=1 Tax=Nocardia fluminea TaxID=134984 RepID=UPI003657FF8E
MTGWQGPASESFRTGWTEVCTGVAGVLGALTEMADALGVTGVTLSDQDRDWATLERVLIRSTGRSPTDEASDSPIPSRGRSVRLPHMPRTASECRRLATQAAQAR